MSNLPTVHEWVRAAKAGEDAAWTGLYRQYYPGTYAVALRICGNPMAAEDAVQDAFLTAYLKLAQLTDPSAFGGWLKKIVTHACYRALQRNRSTERLDGIPPETDRYWHDEINQTFDQLSTQSRLSSALAQLPDVLRSTLLLRYFSTFQSYEEIAAILGVPVGTVRSRLNQARLKLTEQWHNHPDVSEFRASESDEWDGFHRSVYGGMHQSDECKNQLLDHLHKHIRITRADGNVFTGSLLLERMVADDRNVGSWLKPITVVSSGTITIIEASHVNVPEHPDHCPTASVAVLHREQGKVNQMRLYTSAH